MAIQGCERQNSTASWDRAEMRVHMKHRAILHLRQYALLVALWARLWVRKKLDRGSRWVLINVAESEALATLERFLDAIDT